MKRKKKKKHRKTNGIIKIINKIIFALNFCFWKVRKNFFKKQKNFKNKKTNERTKNKHRSLSLCLCVCVSSAYLHTNKTKNVRTGNESKKKSKHSKRTDMVFCVLEKMKVFFLKFFFCWKNKFIWNWCLGSSSLCWQCWQPQYFFGSFKIIIFLLTHDHPPPLLIIQSWSSSVFFFENFGVWLGWQCLKRETKKKQAKQSLFDVFGYSHNVLFFVCWTKKNKIKDGFPF